MLGVHTACDYQPRSGRSMLWQICTDPRPQKNRLFRAPHAIFFVHETYINDFKNYVGQVLNCVAGFTTRDLAAKLNFWFARWNGSLPCVFFKANAMKIFC